MRWRVGDIQRFVEGETVEPTAVFKAVYETFTRYVDFKSNVESAILSLWTIGTYFYTMLPAYPYVALKGPNNFSYLQSKRRDGGAYKRLFGLHNGLDFGIPHGTPLQAMDWGVVVHTSSRLNDTPFGAKPFSVAIVYGKYLFIYGHVSDSISVNVGDLVSPGQPIGLSGTDPDDGPHLHFETLN